MESDLGKLFIGGISWDTDEERLREYFSKYGEVIEAVIMRDRTTGRARGFGFIVFADPSVSERVIMEKHTIDGRTVEAKKAVPRDDQQTLKRNVSPILQMSPGHNNGGRTKKIFVGGLPSNITESEFKNYFDQFGIISDVVVMYDHNTQRPRGFGFITFDSEDSVDKVLHKSFHQLNGKMVEVKRAVPKELSFPPVLPPLPSPSNRSPILGYGNYRSSGNSYFNNFTRFNPIGNGNRTAFSGFGFGLNPELNLNPSYDGTSSTFGGRISTHPYYNGSASPNRYNTPIGYNRTDHGSSHRELWSNRTDSSGGFGWNLGGSVGTNRGDWGLSGLGNGSGWLGPNGSEGSIGEVYRGGGGSGGSGRSGGGSGRSGGSVYSDLTWQQPVVHQSVRPFGYGIGNVDSDPPNGSEGYTGSYNVGNRGIAA